MSEVIEVSVNECSVDDYPYDDGTTIVNKRIMSINEGATTAAILADPRNEIRHNGIIYGVQSWERLSGSSGFYYRFHIQARHSVADRV